MYTDRISGLGHQDDGAHALRRPIRLADRYFVDLLFEALGGLVAVLVYGVLPLLAIQRSRRRESRKALADGTLRISPAEETLALDAIRCAHPDFAPDDLLARTQQMFHRIQEAQRARSWGVARSYLSDGALAELTVRPRFRDDNPSPAGLHSLRIAEARSDGTFDFVRVHLVVQCGALRLGRGPVGERPVESRVDVERGFIEERNWTLLRRRGARTRPDAPAQGSCFSCGAPLPETADGCCTGCGRYLRSTTRDWLVVATKSHRWPPPAPAGIPGVLRLCQRDPAFHPLVLEDRARWLFWKIVLASHSDQPERLGAGFHPEWRAGWFERRGCDSPLRPRGDRTGIAGVDCLGIPYRGAADEWERALVRVRWVERNTADRETLLVLGRNAAFSTDPDAVLSAAHCQRCGAPEMPGSTASCAHCGTLLLTDWTLLEDHEGASDEAQRWHERLPEP